MSRQEVRVYLTQWNSTYLADHVHPTTSSHRWQHQRVDNDQQTERNHIHHYRVRPTEEDIPEIDFIDREPGRIAVEQCRTYLYKSDSRSSVGCNEGM